VNVRNVLIALNVIVVVAMGVFAVVLLQRHREEERPPPNQTPFLPDEDLETRRLERVLGWSLIAAAVIAVALPLYWLREPSRMRESSDYFDEGAVARGATLYANPTMEAYDSAISQQCANCHGPDGAGGSAPAVYTDPQTGEARRVSWRAPALNTVLLRFDEDEVRQVITYGRPGTRMQPFGVEGGGPLQHQSVDDLIAYIDSIQLTPEEAQAQAARDLAAARAQAEAQLEAARTALDDARAALAELREDPEATPAAILAAEAAVEKAEAALEWAQEWAERRVGVTDGQLLFELYCARCHTKGWSIFSPTEPGLDRVLGPAGGGGTVGFSLRDGAVERRFPLDEQGEPSSQLAFVTEGSQVNEGYGELGIGSGRMPGFGNLLTEDMIRAIVEYERHCLEVTDPSQPAAEQSTLAEVAACRPIEIDLEEGAQ
jgi:mono/diheme cytochrome c family protein